MVKAKADLLRDVTNAIGDKPDDSMLELLGDISDTLDEYENNANTAEQRRKDILEQYKARFYSANDDDVVPEKTENDSVTKKVKTFEELFD